MTVAYPVRDVLHYHDARLNAAIDRRPELDLVLVQTAREADYAAIVRTEGQARASRYRLVGLDSDDGLERALDRVRPRLVLVSGWGFATSLRALAWAVRHGVPTVLLSESAHGDSPRRGPAEWCKARLVRLASAYLAGGVRHLDYLVGMGVPATRIFLGYDAVDNAHFAAGADRARSQAGTLRAQLGLPERFFLASARFVPRKNLALLIEAFARYRRDAGAGGWSLVVLGGGELAAELHAQVERLGLADAVLFPGFRGYDELPVWYGLASCFVHASTSEQWGLVVNEALASGLPVIVSERCGCVPELVADGRNGFAFDPFSTDALVERLRRVAGSGPDLAAMGAASRAIVAAWGVERFAQGLSDAMDRAAVASPRRDGPLDRLLLRLVARWLG